MTAKEIMGVNSGPLFDFSSHNFVTIDLNLRMHQNVLGELYAAH